MRRQTKQPVFIVVTIVIFYLPSLQYAWILRTVPRNVNNHLPRQQHPPFTDSPLHGPSASAGSRNYRCVFQDTATATATATATNTKARSVLWSLPPTVPVPEDDNHDDNDENGERELVRAGRRNRRTATREVQGPPNSSSNDNEHDFDTWENPAGRGVDQDDDNDEDDEDYLYDDDDDDWMDENDMGTISYDLLLEDVIIPNPLLDSMDPDGAADRFPELIRDPKFWLDMVLFLAFLDFLSAAGPQSNPFPDLPWFY
jgi:hypothetical protein